MTLDLIDFSFLLITLDLCKNFYQGSRLPADMPLYDILNEFQKGSSHMAAVVKAKGKTKTLLLADLKISEESKEASGDSDLTTPLLSKPEEKSDCVVVDIDKWQNKQVNGNKPASLLQNDASNNLVARSSEDCEEEEVIGIITLEDVFEELLQASMYLVLFPKILAHCSHWMQHDYFTALFEPFQIVS